MWTERTDSGLSAVANLAPQLPVVARVERRPTQQWAPIATSVTQSPPAWHPDPRGSGALRWWDGMAWTQHIADPRSAAFASTTVVNIAAGKSVGVAFLLTFLFGPFGLLYSTVTGGVVMLVVEVLLFILGFVTLGGAWLLFWFTWVACIV